MYLMADGANSGSSGFDFRINEANQLQLFMGAGNAAVTGLTPLSTNTFYLATAAWTPSGKEVFLNGVSDGADDTDELITSGTTLEIGRSPVSSEYYFDGIIDECGIWDEVLTDEQIEALYNSGAGRTYPF